MANFEVDHALVTELEDRRFAAMLTNNPDEIEPLLDDEVIYIHSSSVRHDKQAYLDFLREGRVAYLAVDRKYHGIVSLGESSFFVSGRVGIDLTVNGKPAQLDNLFIAIWIKRDDDVWRLISWQSTPVTKR
jgi:hypothetical protein